MEIALAERALLMFDFHRANSKPTGGALGAGGAGPQRVPRRDMGQRGGAARPLSCLPAVSLSNRQVFPGFQRQ